MTFSEVKALHKAGKIRHAIISSRHPAERMVSSLSFFFALHRKKAVETADDLKPRTLHFLRSSRMGFDRRGDYIGISFADFLKAIVTHTRARSPLDHHFRPQIDSRKEAKFILSLHQLATFVDIHDYAHALPKIAASLRSAPPSEIPQLNKLPSPRSGKAMRQTATKP